MGLALYHSLREHSNEPFTLWVLCFDQKTYEILDQLTLPGMRLISQEAFEAGDDELLQAKQNRNRVEYYWTCTPSLPLFILDHNPHVDLITYLDADLFFFSNPTPIFKELGDGSILIVGHRFPRELLDKESFGIYNVSFLCFRRDQHGLSALRWWRDRCNEWCYKYLEFGRYGDQKYLDDWPSRFKNVIVLHHKGAGLAPWNMYQYQIIRRNDALYVDEDPLIFFHFHKFRMENTNYFSHNTIHYVFYYQSNPLKYEHIKNIYMPYARFLKSLSEKLSRIDPFFPMSNSASIFTILRGLSKGKYFLVDKHPLSVLVSRFGLWRAEGEWLVREGDKLHNQNNLLAAHKTFLAAALRCPRIIFDNLFRLVSR